MVLLSLETERNYTSGFFYETDHLTGGSRELLHFTHEEGRVLKQGNVFRYEYNLTDHLGNVRLNFADVDENGSIDELTEVLSEQHYYPFGGQLSGLATLAGVENRYKYNGKELHAEKGLRWYDYGARMYDPAIGRWNGVDPSAEKYTSWSPYNYTFNNPMIYTDPTGEDARLIIHQDDEGNWTITIQSTVYIYGENASQERVDELNANKGDTFETKSYEDEDGSTVTVGFDVNFVYAENEEDIELEEGDNKLKFPDKKFRSHIDTRNDGIRILYDEKGNFRGYANNTGNEGRVSNDQQDEFTVYHETLHFLGLSDRYTDINYGKFNRSKAQDGFSNDIMGSVDLKIDNIAHYKNWGNFARRIGTNDSYILKVMVDKLNYKLITPK